MFYVNFVGTEKNPVQVVEQCAWAIGNVAGEAEDLRDLLLLQGALPALARNLFSPSVTLARTAAWALSNLIKVLCASIELRGFESLSTLKTHFLNVMHSNNCSYIHRC